MAPDALLPYAQRYAQFPQNENARSNFVLRIRLSTDVEALRAVAANFTLEPHVVQPIWVRIAELAGDDPDLLMQAAYVFYSMGDDAGARQTIERVLSISESHVPALELTAMMTADVNERKALFQKILDIDPTNRQVFNQLLMLR